MAAKAAQPRRVNRTAILVSGTAAASPWGTSTHFRARLPKPVIADEATEVALQGFSLSVPEVAVVEAGKNDIFRFRTRKTAGTFVDAVLSPGTYDGPSLAKELSRAINGSGTTDDYAFSWRTQFDVDKKTFEVSTQSTISKRPTAPALGGSMQWNNSSGTATVGGTLSTNAATAGSKATFPKPLTVQCAQLLFRDNNSVSDFGFSLNRESGGDPIVSFAFALNAGDPTQSTLTPTLRGEAQPPVVIDAAHEVSYAINKIGNTISLRAGPVSGIVDVASFGVDPEEDGRGWAAYPSLYVHVECDGNGLVLDNWSTTEDPMAAVSEVVVGGEKMVINTGDPSLHTDLALRAQLYRLQDPEPDEALGVGHRNTTVVYLPECPATSAALLGFSPDGAAQDRPNASDNPVSWTSTRDPDWTAIESYASVIVCSPSLPTANMIAAFNQTNLRGILGEALAELAAADSESLRFFDSSPNFSSLEIGEGKTVVLYDIEIELRNSADRALLPHKDGQYSTVSLLFRDCLAP